MADITIKIVDTDDGRCKFSTQGLPTDDINIRELTSAEELAYFVTLQVRDRSVSLGIPQPQFPQEVADALKFRLAHRIPPTHEQQQKDIAEMKEQLKLSREEKKDAEHHDQNNNQG